MGECVRMNDQTLHWNASHAQMGAKNRPMKKIGSLVDSLCRQHGLTQTIHDILRGNLLFQACKKETNVLLFHVYKGVVYPFGFCAYYIRKIMFYGAIDMTAQTTRAKIAIGYRIGHLRVEEATSQHKNGYTIWRCRCDCGGEIDAPLHQLTAGYRKSCGCLSHPPLKDYLGKRFSMLTVTGYAGKEDGQHLWRCKCDCGKETVVRQTNLQSGKTKSCGCLQEKQLLENLKLCEGTSVTILEAGRRRLRPTNTSGVTGVYRNRRTGRWCAQITFKRKTYYLGVYEKKDDAIRARQRGEKLHENFIAWY